MGKPNARERILEAAGKLFHQQGYSNVGINEIIKQAETAKASFYQHFESKEALCEVWLKTIHDLSEDRRRSIINAPLTPAEKLGKYIDALSCYLMESDFRGCPYSNTCAMVESEGVMEQIKSHKAALRNFFKAIVEQEFGEAEGTGALADQIFLTYSGAVTEAQNLKELWPVESARSAILTLFSAFGDR